MPNTPNTQTMHMGNASGPDAFNESVLEDPGQLGAPHHSSDSSYQRVKLDSGATSATTVGAVAANQLAYWKDKDSYVVTNDSRQTIGGPISTGAFRNFVAGVFRTSVTAGYYCDILQSGDNISVADGGNTFVVGASVIAESGTAAAADVIAVGVAPTYRVLGIARGAASGGNVSVDVSIAPIP